MAKVSNEKYNWIEDEKEFILKRPDTYIGNVNTQEIDTYKLINNKLVPSKINASDGLFQIFNEPITNSVDEHIRTKRITLIKVKIDTKKNEITIFDNGGIPVRKHSTIDIYVPDMIVSKLRAGTNFNDDEQRIVAGRNGLGVTLTNIFSKKFSIETNDGTNTFYKQYANNLSIQYSEEITQSKNESGYTEIKFIPDLSRFNCTSLDNDFIHLVRKKLIDIAGCNNELKLTLQIDKNPIEKYSFKTFKEYCELYLNTDFEPIFEDSNDWSICIGQSKTKFNFISFVNSLEVINGGEHINYIINQITTWLKEQIQKKYKVNINAYNIKQHLFLFVKCNIVNPSFSSQTKHELSTKPSDFGTEHKVSDKFLNKLFKSDILQDIVEWAEKKQELEDQKKIAYENRRLDKINVPKLKDAKSKDRSKCSLSIVEGDSAGGGFAKHRNQQFQGIYPIQGKSLGNVYGLKDTDIYSNTELVGLMSSIGLKIGQKATNLRYNEININTDSDIDGISITSLLINFFNTYWPELFDDGRVFQVITPVAVAKKGSQSKEFYSDLEYETWINEHDNTEIRKWNISFKKGLAALSDKEFKTILTTPKRIKLLRDDKTDELLDVWFGNDSDKRKQLISSTFCNGVIYNKSEKYISEYLTHEYLQFAYYTIEHRAMPSVIDGFKPVQRKVINESIALWKNNNKELKIYVLAGYCAARQKYHHGDASLNKSIVNMAQSFKNNLSLLDEHGQFGDLRNKKAGAPRYIGTSLNDNFKLMYKDNNLLTKKYDEGEEIEPKYFLPIIPMVLINGSSGIAVGFATNILNRNPKNIITTCIDYLNNKKIDINKLKPYYNQFTNNIQTKLIDKQSLKWSIQGKLEIINATTVKITELPPNYEFEQYDAILTKLIAKKIITDYDNNCTDKVEYIVKFTRENLNKHTEDSLIKVLKLYKNETENLNTLDEHGKFKSFNSIEELMKYFIDFRLTFYDKRKNLIIDNLSHDIQVLTNKINFLQNIIDNKIKVYKQPKQSIINQLTKLNFDLIDESFNYLLNLPIYSFTKETIEDLKNKLKDNTTKLKEIKKKEPKQMYVDDLNELLTKLK